MIGMAFTGTGKSLVFQIPVLCLALEEEKKMPIINGEGPFGLLVVPSHELAIQNFEILNTFGKALLDAGYPAIRIMLCIGGMDLREQLDQTRRGVHIVVGTPGRLSDLLTRGRINLSMCRFITLDECDRLLEPAFENEIRNIFAHTAARHQTLLFSATMPKKVQDFIKEALIRPIIVNVGRAGAANLDVVQEVEYVKQEAKLVYLLECLKKTSPPVLVFCENKNDVDDVYEYLLLKGVDAAALHGGKDQEERAQAVEKFKTGKKDVLVATDVAAKGLDFPDVKHVINYDMPKDIESYVHRIGRTGRCGKTGLATSFVNRSQDPTTLLDLKYLLMEAKQYVPSFLKSLKDPNEFQGECSYCGGLGHRVTNCPKLETQKLKSLSASHTTREILHNAGRFGGTTNLGGGDL
eukprot:TRINITY_DN11797_c0_g1_i2.p1 TRINITY_DN11797_c0_g1~~TRINITY_DN11797_c0_g1_i2.p1  ORF type:complete len:408 (-),score=69.06 TRINITY_DN11797_c0_g1_i2:64-1287(-)